MKDLGLPRKYAPLVSIALGLVAGVFLVDPHDLTQGLVDGLFLGLSAVGVHSGLKNVREGVLDTIAQLKQAKQAKQTQAAEQQAKQQ
jgi:hypothetical protein